MIPSEKTSGWCCGRLWAAVLISILVTLSAGVAAASENRGAPEMVLEGGSRGRVPFSHLKHQNALNDCMPCHALFPQEKGSIEALKARGILARKEVMNQQCIKCHRTRKDASQPGGPITCGECHKKE